MTSHVLMALRVEELSLAFAGVAALRSVSFEVPAGRIVSLIGPNGAGKTSLVNCLTGYYRPSQGRVHVFDQDVTRRPPHRVARVGVARTYQHIGLFAGLTVQENLLVGRHLAMRGGLLGGGLTLPWTRREEAAERAAVAELMEFLELAPHRHRVAGRLPYGLQKRVDFGRALAMRPRLLLLDEPMAGMNHEEKREMARFVLATRAYAGVTIVLIEHDMGLVMGISDAVAVLDFGRLIAYGEPKAVGEDPAVVSAYLGTDPRTEATR
jgi:branched-chain amino acid transport system ATP-binding protein